ncbi:MAG: hypothetical protein PHO18_05135, partial [Synergistaceae bacterium]|nr:hypothetical protein [Synergistaceae bacterium]
DSTASGLLVILVGAATRLSNFVMDMPKSYETVSSLGVETSTDDASGDVIAVRGFDNINENDIDIALPYFMGFRMQTPPNVSAVHIDGRRAHEMTREGIDVYIEKKPVYFASSIRTSEISDEGKVSFLIKCRKGTYIRSFVRDIGEHLCCGAHVSELKRISCGPFDIEAALDASLLEKTSREDLAERVLPLESVCPAAASYICGRKESERLINGQHVSLHGLKRENFSRYSNVSGNIIVRSEIIFSICRFKDQGKSYDLLPAVNIINDRSN